MQKIRGGFLLCSLFCFIHSLYGLESRIKDIASFEGVRDNLLIGYGLVVGLNGTGDNLKNAMFTEKRLSDFLEKLGVNLGGSSIKTKNIAAVMVTANLLPFLKQGSRIDVNVSALGDSKSLRGGLLLATPLLAADGNVYAVSQGKISIHEISEIPDVKTKNKAIETNGYIQNGAIVENTTSFSISDLHTLNLSLNSPDFTTSVSVETAINNKILGNIATAIDAATVQIIIPNNRRKDVIKFISEIESISISPDYRAKIIINESTGTVIIGDRVNVRSAAIAQGNLIVNIGQQEYLHGLDPNTTQEQLEDINRVINQNRGSNISQMDEVTSLGELVNGLNKLGVWPKDIINILYSLKMVGAIDAVIEVR